MSEIIVVSRQAYELDQTRVNLEAKIRSMEKESNHRTRERIKLEDKIKELKNLIEELKANAVKKDTHLDHLQKRSDELYALIGVTREIAIRKFNASSEFTNLVGINYVASFEDFRMDARSHFPGVDFSPIKLRIGAESSLL